MRLLKAIIVITVCVTAWDTTARAAESPKVTQPSHSEMRVRLREDLGTLDWNYGEVNPEVVVQLMQGLFISDRSGEPVSALAESWTRSKDGKTWTFLLKTSPTWTDGKLVCAEDFVASFRRVLKPGQSPYAHYYFDIRGAKDLNAGKGQDLGVRAEGCGKLIIELERPITFLPSLLTHFTSLPIRQDMLEKYPRMFATGEGLITNGPYRLKEWKPQQRYVLEARPDVPGAWVKTLRFLVIPDDSTALSLFDTNKVDLTRDLPYIDRKKLMARPEFRSFPSHIGYYIGFNKNDSDLKNVHLRRALIQAVNLAEIPRFLQGGEVAAEGWYPSYFSAKAGRRIPEFDVQRAREELKKSGFDTKKKLNAYYYIKEAHHPLMQWLQQQWQSNLNVTVDIHPVEGKVYWSEVTKEKYPIFLSGISAFVNSPVPYLTELMSDSHANWTGLKSKDYDEIVKNVLVENSPVELKKQADKAEEILLTKEAIALPLYFRANLFLVKKPWATTFWVSPLNYFYLYTPDLVEARVL